MKMKGEKKKEGGSRGEKGGEERGAKRGAGKEGMWGERKNFNFEKKLVLNNYW